MEHIQANISKVSLQYCFKHEAVVLLVYVGQGSPLSAPCISSDLSLSKQALGCNLPTPQRQNYNPFKKKNTTCNRWVILITAIHYNKVNSLKNADVPKQRHKLDLSCLCIFYICAINGGKKSGSIIDLLYN